jgi:hypothetical protein
MLPPTPFGESITVPSEYVKDGVRRRPGHHGERLFYDDVDIFTPAGQEGCR